MSSRGTWPTRSTNRYSRPTLYHTKGLRVSDYAADSIRVGMLYSRMPTYAASVALDIDAGDFSKTYEGYAHIFLDYSSAADPFSLAVSDSRPLAVLYRDGSLMLDVFASLNAYVFKFRWFRTSVSESE